MVILWKIVKERDDIDKKAFGEHIKQLIEERGIESNSQLSRDANISTATIGRIVAGKQQARPETIMALAPHLGVSYKHLAEIAGYTENDNIIMCKNETLHRRIDNLSSRDIMVVETLVQALDRRMK